MTKEEFNKIAHGIDAYKLIDAIYVSAQAILAMKIQVPIEMIHSECGFFQAEMTLSNFPHVTMENIVDTYMAGPVAHDIFDEFTHERCCHFSFSDINHPGRYITQDLIKIHQEFYPSNMSALEIKLMIYRRVYCYLEPRFNALLSLSFNLAAVGKLDGAEIARHFIETGLPEREEINDL